MDILNRISSWKSVLLIDEADIFLSHRNNDLERSAIVGIFLRLFEYFKGVLFLTSNRLDVIDAAVLSRVTLVLKYPNLTKETRLAIWDENFKSAGIKINQINALATVELSGRDIRNYVKLLHYMESKEVSEDSVMQLIEDYPKN
jgi:SpoVK/Ycf46/Vps4 family AAA+-type ATPase